MFVPDHEVEKLSYSWDSGITYEEKYIYYDVYWQSESHMREQMFANGGVDDFWVPFFAYTEQDIQFDHIENHCDTVIPSVLTITYTLPKWVDKKDAPTSMQNRWDAFMRKLIEHEKQHGQIALDSWQQLEKEIYSQPLTNNCFRYYGRLYGPYSKEIEKSAELQVEYDTRTDHGVTEWVIW